MTRRKSVNQPGKKRESDQERRIDEELKDTFPASDPPSFAGGRLAVGEPRRPKERKPAS